MSEKPKPCPWCRGEVFVIELDDYDFTCRCTICGANGPIEQTRQEAQDAWDDPTWLNPAGTIEKKPLQRWSDDEKEHGTRGTGAR